MKTLIMINISEIQPGELIKVLVNLEDDIEDEIYAKVKENNRDYVVVSYYTETSMTYKGARLYELEDNDELVQEENLSEHHQSNNYFKNVKDNLYCMIDEIDSEEESDIIDESDDSGSDLEDFIVSDSEVDGIVIPPSNYRVIDKEWKEWEPRSPGSLRYKQMVDNIESIARVQADELNF
jgi:TusA-related sulfurtransferase